MIRAPAVLARASVLPMLLALPIMSGHIGLILELRFDPSPDGFAGILATAPDDAAMDRLWRTQLAFPWMTGMILSGILVKLLKKPTSWMVPSMRNSLVTAYVVLVALFAAPVMLLYPEIGLWPRGITLAAFAFFLLLAWGRLARVAAEGPTGRGCLLQLAAMFATFAAMIWADSLLRVAADSQPVLFTTVCLGLAAWQLRGEYSADVWRRRMDVAQDADELSRCAAAGRDDIADRSDGDDRDEWEYCAPRQYSLSTVLNLARCTKDRHLRSAGGMVFRFLLILAIMFILRAIGAPSGMVFAFLAGWIVIFLGPPPEPPLSAPLPRADRAPLIFWSTLTFAVAVLALCLPAMQLAEWMVVGTGMREKIDPSEDLDPRLFIASYLAIFPLAIWLPRPLKRQQLIPAVRDLFDPGYLLITCATLFVAMWMPNALADSAVAQQVYGGVPGLLAMIALVVWPLSYVGLRLSYRAGDLPAP